MTKKINKTSFVLSLLALVFAFGLMTPSLTPAMAQPAGGDSAQQGLNDIGQAFPGTARDANVDIKSMAKKIIDWALYLAAMISVVFIIIGGYFYITSAGNPAQAGKGKSTLVNALIGLTLVILSYIIVQIVYNFLTK